MVLKIQQKLQAQILRRKEIIDYFRSFYHLARGISMGERTARDDEKIRVSDKISINKERGNAFMEKINVDFIGCLIVQNVQQEQKRKF